jgi:hypothetical protein
MRGQPRQRCVWATLGRRSVERAVIEVTRQRRSPRAGPAPARGEDDAPPPRSADRRPTGRRDRTAAGGAERQRG